MGPEVSSAPDPHQLHATKIKLISTDHDSRNPPAHLSFPSHAPRPELRFEHRTSIQQTPPMPVGFIYSNSATTNNQLTCIVICSVSSRTLLCTRSAGDSEWVQVGQTYCTLSISSAGGCDRDIKIIFSVSAALGPGVTIWRYSAPRSGAPQILTYMGKFLAVTLNFASARASVMRDKRTDFVSAKEPVMHDRQK